MLLDENYLEPVVERELFDLGKSVRTERARCGRLHLRAHNAHAAERHERQRQGGDSVSDVCVLHYFVPEVVVVAGFLTGT
jgi:hypothetical protein